MNSKKALVAMSGGVDSAYAAKKLKDQGHKVEGAVLIMHEYTELDAAIAEGFCFSVDRCKINPSHAPHKLYPDLRIDHAVKV